MPLDRIAVISDVHGNVTALEAVLADVAARGVDQIVNLGDMVGKGPRGAQAADRCLDVCAVNVRGNWEDMLARVDDDDSEGMRWWRDEAGPARLEELASLPLSHDLLVSGRRVRLFHASARSVYVRVHAEHDAQEFDGMFAATELTGHGPLPQVVGYGDIHSAYLRVRGARTLFNVGSVGNPLDEPVPSYAILEGRVGDRDPGPFSVHHVRVPYDVDAEVAHARAVAMPEADAWETELRSAVYRRRAAPAGPARA